jgi:hypothetical protein
MCGYPLSQRIEAREALAESDENEIERVLDLVGDELALAQSEPMRLGPAIARGKMKTPLNISAAIVCGRLVGGVPLTAAPTLAP